MPIPYASAGKSLKKQKAKVVKAKTPVPVKKVVPVKGKPMFTPPGMDAEDMIDGGRDEATEKN